MSQIRTLGGNYVVHLTYKPNGLDEGGIGWIIACMPEVLGFKTSVHQPNFLRSDDTRAVTCELCKKTVAFREKRKREVP